MELATDPAGYSFWVDERVRFADLDVLGHVNNKAFFTFAESGRVVFLKTTGLWKPGAQRQGVIVRAEMDYHRELHYPADLRIGMRVLKVGRTSFTLGLGIFNGDQCVATNVTVVVRIDTQTREPVALNEEELAGIQPYLATP
jgi:acyl-CoA thioester hydrolase